MIQHHPVPKCHIHAQTLAGVCSQPFPGQPVAIPSLCCPRCSDFLSQRGSWVILRSLFPCSGPWLSPGVTRISQLSKKRDQISPKPFQTLSLALSAALQKLLKPEVWLSQAGPADLSPSLLSQPLAEFSSFKKGGKQGNAGGSQIWEHQAGCGLPGLCSVLRATKPLMSCCPQDHPFLQALNYTESELVEAIIPPF